MKTDEPIYRLLSTGAEAFRVLTGGLELVGPYQFRSLTFKSLERRADGVFEPQVDTTVCESHSAVNCSF
jgi:predicted transposase YdaD